MNAYLSKTNNPTFTDNWELLENRLKTMDWFYSMSDDHRYWVAGEAKMKEIDNLMGSLKLIDPDRVTTLYNKYSPKRFV